MSPLVIVAVVVVFGLLVTLHELGHFVLAKVNGVKVLEFNIGFGSPMFRLRRGETQYAVRFIPLGGYVRMAGMDDGDESPRSFNRKAVWRRVSIIGAGAVTNLLLPIPIFLAMSLLQSGPVTVITLVSPGPAQQAGVPLKAEIRALDGHPVTTVQQLRSVVTGGGGKPIEVQYLDPSSRQVVQKTVIPEKIDGAYRLGITATPGGGYDIGRSLRASVDNTRDAIVGTALGVVALVTGHIPGGLGGNCGPSGPIGIVRATVSAAEAGLLPLLQFMAFLSVNLGILNLLPLPALDGGRLAFLVVEGVRRRRIDPEKEQRFHYVGLMVLLGLVLLISYNDLARIGTPFDTLVRSCGG